MKHIIEFIQDHGVTKIKDFLEKNKKSERHFLDPHTLELFDGVHRSGIDIEVSDLKSIIDNWEVNDG